MSDHPLSDNEIERLLESIAEDRSIAHPERARLREDVLASFRTSAADASAAPSSGGTLVEIAPRQDVCRSSRPVRDWALIGVAAAAVLLLALVIWPDDAAQENETISTTAPLLDDEGRAPEGAVAPGAYWVEGIAGGFHVALPDGVTVASSGPGFVELRPVDDQWGSSLFIMAAEEPLDDLVTRYREAGLVTEVRGSAQSVNGVVTEYEIRPTNQARGPECEQDPDCLRIGVTSLDPAGVNLGREISDGDDRLWTLYRSGTVYAPFTRDANAIVESIDLD